MDLYVYYEVAPAKADDVRRRVRAMQQDLAHAVSRCRLLTRVPAGHRAETWMEIYEGAPPDFEDTLSVAVTRHALSADTGERHVERFVEATR